MNNAGRLLPEWIETSDIETKEQEQEQHNDLSQRDLRAPRISKGVAVKRYLHLGCALVECEGAFGCGDVDLLLRNPWRACGVLRPVAQGGWDG